MDITIKINTDNDAFRGSGFYPELRRCFEQAVRKIHEQRKRPPAKCTAAESADKILDSNGNTVGSVELSWGGAETGDNAKSEFIRLARVAAKIVRDQTWSWAERYDLIFSPEISGAILNTGVRFEHCDPDTSYEEDVRAYVNAVTARADELKKEKD